MLLVLIPFFQLNMENSLLSTPNFLQTVTNGSIDKYYREFQKIRSDPTAFMPKDKSFSSNSNYQSFPGNIS